MRKYQKLKQNFGHHTKLNTAKVGLEENVVSIGKHAD